MLKSLRDGAKKGVLKFILLGFMALAVGGLVLTDVGGFFRGGISNNIVAKGKNIEISTMEFDRVVRRILTRQGIDSQEAYEMGLINQILVSEIQTRIITREAQKLGIQVSDDMVTDQISKLAAPLAQDGRTKSEALREVLRIQGVSEGEFVSAIRQEMENAVFQDAFFTGTRHISKAQATALAQYQNESRDVDAIILKHTDIKDINTPSDESLARFYQSNKLNYLIPERRDITIATLKKEMIEDQVEISDNDLREAYEDNIDTYQTPAQRTLQQAILSSQEDAQKIADKAKSGTSLEKAVEDITGKKAAYLGENDFGESGLLEDIATPVFAAQKGDIVGPIQSPLGFHVMVVKDIKEPHLKSFDSVKASIKDNMLQDRLIDQLLDTANTLDDQLAGGTPLDELVSEFNLTTETINQINQGGFNEANKDLLAGYQGDKAEILEIAFDYDAGEVSPVMELDDGRFIAIQINAVQERDYTPLAEVKDALLKKWKTEQQRLANLARAEDLMAKIQDGTSLKDAAKEASASVQSFKNLKRTDEAKAPLTIPALREIFDTDQDKALRLTYPEGYIIGKVTDITLPATDNVQADAKKLQDQVADSLPQEMLIQYINAMADTYKVKTNDNVLKSLYGTQE